MKTARSLFVAGVLALSTFGIGTASAATPAAPPGGQAAPITNQVSGTVSGTTWYRFGAQGCSFVYQEFDITYLAEQGRRQTGSLQIQGCVGFDAPSGFSQDGTFVLTAPNGAVLTGSVSGEIFGGGLALDLTLQVESGTRNFRRLTGEIRLTSFDFFPSTEPASFTGTLDAQLIRH
jgi:hypothetical protein